MLKIEEPNTIVLTETDLNTVGRVRFEEQMDLELKDFNISMKDAANANNVVFISNNIVFLIKARGRQEGIVSNKKIGWENGKILITAGDIVRHYKGGIYRVLGTSTHTETEEEMVTYQEYKAPNSHIWTRPACMFYEEIEVDGEIVERFEWIGRNNFVKQGYTLEAMAYNEH